MSHSIIVHHYSAPTETGVEERKLLLIWLHLFNWSSESTLETTPSSLLVHLTGEIQMSFCYSFLWFFNSCLLKRHFSSSSRTSVYNHCCICCLWLFMNFRLYVPRHKWVGVDPYTHKISGRPVLGRSIFYNPLSTYLAVSHCIFFPLLYGNEVLYLVHSPLWSELKGDL